MITGDLLTAVPLLSSLPQAERDGIAANAADLRLRTDEWVIHEGETPAFYVVLEGTLAVFKNIGGLEQQITSYKPGDFFGEVPLLLGSVSMASVQATAPSRLMRLDAESFHGLVAGCAKLNAEILKTMASRVSSLQQLSVDASGPSLTVVGRRRDPACHELRDFLLRNHVAFRWVEPGDAGNDRETEPVRVALSRGTPNAPIVCLSDGEQLTAPSLREVAASVGLQTQPRAATYDVTVIGGGPAGLAAAVYGASEGLKILLIERVAAGGQAGTSSRIENYLGFPNGISGDDLSVRARQQAIRFGAEIVVAREATSITTAHTSRYTITLDGGDVVDTSSVVLATGVNWRRLSIPGVDAFLDKGVYYGAAASEATALRGRDVYLVGGGNSAGQAAMLFSNYAEQVTLLVRGPALAASMSQYLIDQLETKSNITIRTMAEVAEVEGGDSLESITIMDHTSGAREQCECGDLFVFIGARAETDWLPATVIRDEWDYVCTGRDVMDLLAAGHAAGWALERDPFLLETSAPGIFAAGDVRHGSIKRVAAGVGEGSMAIAFVHQYLAELRSRETAA
ncbi:MAG: FAD-dependent oxidoreductase [Gemmatimonadaceae bacterium]